MVEKLFAGNPPREDSLLLDPGCGTGEFILGVLRWAQRTRATLPRIMGIDSDPALLSQAAERIGSMPSVTLVEADFLCPRTERFDYIIGNPPYVSITGLTVAERENYRRHFLTAVGRFDLYALFFEQALQLLKPQGRLVFITPEKFIYVESAARLRQQLALAGVQAIDFLEESTFSDRVTYPVITTLTRSQGVPETLVTFRNGHSRAVRLPMSGGSWLPHFSDPVSHDSLHTLPDAFTRISCGVATGADQVYVLKNSGLPDSLRGFAYPTVSGRGLAFDGDVRTSHSMLLPYSRDGALLTEDSLGALGQYLLVPRNHSCLLKRTCVSRKPWYAFHENPPLGDLLRPKILCKDIAASPRFVVDRLGEIVPRHSVYYLVPIDATRIDDLCEYLNSMEVADFLRAHCQRAANGFIRLQSHVLKRVPLPERFVTSRQLACA